MKKFLSLLTVCAILLSGCSPQPQNTDAPAETSVGEIPTETESAASESTAASSSSAPSETSEQSAVSSAPETSAAESSAEVTSTEAAAETSAQTTAKTETPAQSAATGKLSAYADKYEGREQTSDYNYGEALQKSILFYDLQRSGKLPADKRTNWRGDSCLNDGSDAGLDLSGGFFDAGDNVKFNLPMSYTCSMLAWSVIEDFDSYKESGQLEYALDNIRWGNDYFIKCHPEANVYYYQVGDGNADHGWWGSAEVIEAQMKRPSYKVDLNNGGSCVTAGTAAALASCAVLFKDSDSAYSNTCIKHAKELFNYAETVKSDAGYTAANGFYTSNSGFYDELAWAAYWLYKATGESSYLDKSKSYLAQTSGDYKWAQCWDDVSYGTALLLAKETGEQQYKDRIEKHLDYWLSGVAYTPKGLAWLDTWGALRYSTTLRPLIILFDNNCVPRGGLRRQQRLLFRKTAEIPRFR